MENTDIEKTEAAAYAEMQKAIETAEHEGLTLLARIREHGIDHPRVDEQYIEYRRKVDESDAAAKRWRRIFDAKKPIVREGARPAPMRAILSSLDLLASKGAG